MYRSKVGMELMEETQEYNYRTFFYCITYRIAGMFSSAKVSFVFFRSETSWNEIRYNAHVAHVCIK